MSVPVHSFPIECLSLYIPSVCNVCTYTFCLSVCVCYQVEMLRNVQGTDILSERNVQGMDITSERNVQGMGITSERNEQGMIITSERNVQGTDNTCERNVQ